MTERQWLGHRYRGSARQAGVVANIVECQGLGLNFTLNCRVTYLVGRGSLYSHSTLRRLQRPPSIESACPQGFWLAGTYISAAVHRTLISCRRPSARHLIRYAWWRCTRPTPMRHPPVPARLARLRSNCCSLSALRRVGSVGVVEHGGHCLVRNSRFKSALGMLVMKYLSSVFATACRCSVHLRRGL